MARTASTWDSFKDTLLRVLNILNPKTVFEYGPGVSTMMIASHPGVEIVDSVEHDPAWYEKYKWTMLDNVRITLQPILSVYPETEGRSDKYDLIFVDGREREKCLFVARGRLNAGGAIMLHDAERPSYQDMINSFKYKFWTDDGHTVTLTDNDMTAAMLEGIYGS